MVTSSDFFSRKKTGKCVNNSTSKFPSMARIVCRKRLAAFSSFVLGGPISFHLHAAQGGLPVGERPLSKVCATKVPASIEHAASHYLLPITAMGGDAKPLCRFWHHVKPDDDKSMMLWDWIAGAVLLHAVAEQSNIAPYSALVSKAIASDPKYMNRKFKTYYHAMGNIYNNIQESALLARDRTPKNLADHLLTRAPDVAATLQKA